MQPTNPYQNAIVPASLVGGQTIIHRSTQMKMVFNRPGELETLVEVRYYNPVTGLFVEGTFNAVEFDNAPEGE